MAVLKCRDVIFHLRDINLFMVDAWTELFHEHSDTVRVSKGDVFKGGPAVDAIVAPTNSFGFMDGGLDLHYIRHFGEQLQERVHKVIREDYDGELPVGQAIIIPAYGPEGRDETVDWSKKNEGVPIKYLISAPTMRVPMKISDTVNAYLVFRAVILAVRDHNKRDDVEPIKEVLVTGLGTSLGGMPKKRCAYQMLQAYETFALGENRNRMYPKKLKDMYTDHNDMCKYSENEEDKKSAASHLHKS